ncbi:metallophosphoesterase domain containing protein [Nitzschia inconspicua]|uniref:Metallophosphoesterase domain containing protein n=1 Tax=Nitzschia inconspicua TaxID=303405 RepID=A0A9K3KGG4_9STRA|nr:metallophosphoesterase domain containing protein [Nitzschia inconspicua]
MLLAKLHQRSIRTVQMLSTLRREWKEIIKDDAVDPLNQFLQVPRSRPKFEDSSTDYTRIVCMSDTHGMHNDIPFLPKGDVLVHAGDITKYGETGAVQCLSRYFEKQKELFGFQQILCIAGNHDMTFHPDYYEKTWSRHIRPFDAMETRDALQHCHYLEDSATNLLKNTSQIPSGRSTVYGSPWTPNFFQWAFNLERGEALQQVWSRIPEATDVLITHGPPKGRGDMTLHSGHFGCQDLLQEIQQRVRPRLHIYGHIHEGYGTSFDGHTLYVNASSLDIAYEAINPCIVIDLPRDLSRSAKLVEPYCRLQDMGEFVGWLQHNNYLTLAQALETKMQQHSSAFPLPMSSNKFSGSGSYHSLCDFLGWKRRKHRPARRELRIALCQLYAESFF